MTQPHLTSSDTAARLSRLECELAQERTSRSRAEAADRAKADLLATVGQEVRTPLGAIIFMAELLLGSELNESQRRYAETVQQSGQTLLIFLNEILDYCKLEAGSFELEAVPFDFPELIHRVRSELHARAGEKGLASSLLFTEGFPEQLYGDPVRIHQILSNLIDNAVKFTKCGSVLIRAGYGCDGDDIHLRFEVSDTGIGLTSQQVSHLFEPYSQADGFIAVNYEGTGLGLSISRKLCHLMGGTLGCERTPESGSMFWFTVRVKDARTAPGQKVNPNAPTSLGPLEGHILVAEDNHVNQILIEAYLNQFGLTHDIAANGAEAVKMVQNRSYDLVLMDIMMPVVDGLEAAKQIRALGEPFTTLPIIALTANAMKGDRESYIAEGMNGYLSKPLSAASLFDALSVHIGINDNAVAAVV